MQEQDLAVIRRKLSAFPCAVLSRAPMVAPPVPMRGTHEGDQMKITGKVVEKESFNYDEKKDATGKVTREAGTMYFVFFAPSRPRDEAVRVLVKADHFPLYSYEHDYTVEVFQKVDKNVIRTQATEAPVEVA